MPHQESPPPAAPHVVAIPGKATPLLVVHGGVACDPPQGLVALRPFEADGRGGYVAAARAGNDRWGYLNQDGQWVVPPTLDDARSFTDGVARYRQDDRWGWVDLAGDTVIAPRFTDSLAFSQGLAAVQLDSGSWGYLNLSGDLAIDGTFRVARSFASCGLAVAGGPRPGKLGYIDTAGRWGIEPRFEAALGFGPDAVAPAALVRQRMGLIDARGEWVLEPAYPSIEAFNEDGLAYFDEPRSWDSGHGYLDARGQVVVRGDRHLSGYMVCGVARADYNGSRYLRRDGAPLSPQGFSWGSHFNAAGYAVARDRAEPALWGLLRPDGTWQPVGAEVLEPLIDEEGWLHRIDRAHPFAPFVRRDGDLEWLDAEARPRYRLRYEQGGPNSPATLHDRDGAPLWRSGAGDRCARPLPFFCAPIERHLDALGAIDEIETFARTALAAVEDELRALAAGRDPAGVAEPDEDDDVDDDEGVDALALRRTTVRRRLVRAYVDEDHNGDFDFLGGAYGGVVAQAAEQLRQRLTEAFGTPDPDPDSEAFRVAYSADRLAAWPVALRDAWPDGLAPMGLVEANQLWFGVFESSDSGDGDVWYEVWLLAAPSRDALDLAMRLRADDGAPDPPAREVPAAPAAMAAPPSTREEWLAEVSKYEGSIAAVPEDLLDDALVDAALEARLGALGHLPPRWQTSQRLAGLVRQGAAVAAAIPAQCMTAEALTLARELYGDDSDWSWRDQERSRVPEDWEVNSLDDTWGALLSEDDCVRAVESGEQLGDVPHWLRSARVQRAALAADIYNVRWVDPGSITPKLAARAVRHDFGQLIEVLPASLITDELCLASVRANGLSLQHVPVSRRSVAVCVAALEEDSRAFVSVPDGIALDVCGRLIERAQAEPRRDTGWHRYRAWARLRHGDWEGALADATQAVAVDAYPAHAHYVRAVALRELGRTQEASVAAAAVLALSDPYEAEFDADEDTSWLPGLARDAYQGAADAVILSGLAEEPLSLGRVPRHRVTAEMVAVAVAADPEAVALVPKRWLTPELYVVAMRERHKRFVHIPPHLISEEACLEHVRNYGWNLREIPPEHRSVAVCALALSNSERVIDEVPEAIRHEAVQAAERLQRDESDPDEPSREGVTGWLEDKLVQQLGNQGASAPQQALRKATTHAWVWSVMLGAKSGEPVSATGVVAWLARRPFLAMVCNAILGVAALGCHLAVAVAAWRLEGPWVALGTGLLMGYSELYWTWRFFWGAAPEPGLGVAALVVALYVLVGAPLYRRVARAIPERSD